MSKVLVLYYSTYGHIETMAEAVAEGARSAGAAVDVKRVPETVPEAIAGPAHIKLDQAAPVAAVDYLRVVGHLVFAYFWARMAQVALDRIQADGDAVDPFYRAKLHTARFYFAKLLPETASLIRTARSGPASLMAMDESLF